MNFDIGISIVMPVYNTSVRDLETAIRSILEQTFENYEFLIVDDGSNEEVRQYLENLPDERIRIFHNKANLGVTKSLNIGFGQARGKYIARMDGDDISLPDRLEKQYSYMEKNPDVVVCGSRTGTIGMRQPQSSPKMNQVDKEEYRVKMLFMNPGPFHPTAFFRHEKLIEHKIQYDETLYYAQDYGMWATICKYGNICILDDILLLRGNHEKQISKLHREQQIRYDKMTQKKLLSELLGVVSDEEVDMHYFYSTGYYLDATISQEICNWYDRIIQANDQCQLYDKEKLKSKIMIIKKRLIQQTFTLEMSKAEKMKLYFQFLPFRTAIKAIMETAVMKVRGVIQKKYRISILLLSLSFLLILNGASAEATEFGNMGLLYTASGRDFEAVTQFSDEWRFGGKDIDASSEDFDDDLWDTVNIPHTWNAVDGADGDSQYERTVYWYRKTINAVVDGKRKYIEFLGVNQETDLYVNGEHIKLSGSNEYTHKGGYTAFRYDITDALRDGNNTFAIRVDNTLNEEVAPISGDFNMYGGIYRQIYLISVDEVHVDLSNYGSSGLFLTTPNIRSKEKPEDFGALNIRADLVNEGDRDRTVMVTAHIDGDHAPEDIQRTVTIPARGKVTFDEDTFINDPHLWKGIDYSGKTEGSDAGYTYQVTLTISDDEQIIDKVSDRVGFRYVWVDRDTGFYLNGESYPLHGVNRHQYKEGLGSALSEADHQEDFDLIMELGANTVRLCHYPQCDYIYDACDENGIIVWTEIPLVNHIGKAEAFMDVTKGQLVELIRQQYNRPSICFWGLENELKNDSRSPYYTSKELLSALDDLAHQEDRSGRYTAQAINTNAAMDSNEGGWKSDLIAWNIYPGWYSSFDNSFEKVANDKLPRDSRPMALSEYGWGASTTQHELYPQIRENGLLPDGLFHPEEYQNLKHEEAVHYINEHPNLWATYVWCMFDFDVDSRNEGSRAGQNDKGLVTNDRNIKKDSYYLYKANWNKRESFVHITSSRYSVRDFKTTYIKVYSNCDTVFLYLNDKPIGEMTNLGDGVFITNDVDLNLGENTIQAEGISGSKKCKENCTWTRIPSGSTKLISKKSDISVINGAIVINQPMTIAETRKSLQCENDGIYRIFKDGFEVKNENEILCAGMLATVQSEDGQNSQNYLFYLNQDELAYGEKVYFSSEEGENAQHKDTHAININDGRQDTAWVADTKVDGIPGRRASYPEWIGVDLGDEFCLKGIELLFETKKKRIYQYQVYVSSTTPLVTGESIPSDYKLIIDESDNELFEDGHYIIPVNEVNARYIAVLVLGNSLYPDIYSLAAAGIYDLKVYGTTHLSDEKTND